MTPMTPKGTPSHWTIYFGADDCDKRTALAKKLGGKVVVEPQDIPNVGRFSMLFDPQGAFFALLQPKR
jgi:predicted enzyme related to lactoylglutathione lyase